MKLKNKTKTNITKSNLYWFVPLITYVALYYINKILNNGTGQHWLPTAGYTEYFKFRFQSIRDSLYPRGSTQIALVDRYIILAVVKLYVLLHAQCCFIGKEIAKFLGPTNAKNFKHPK